MENGISIDPKTILYVFLAIMAIGFILALILIVFIVWRVKRIQIPPDADFLTALRYTPLSVVILLDLLDLTFDFLGAPIAWVILGYLGLQALRGVTVVESIIPGTQLIPTMTIAWVIARLEEKGRNRFF